MPKTEQLSDTEQEEYEENEIEEDDNEEDEENEEEEDENEEGDEEGEELEEAEEENDEGEEYGDDEINMDFDTGGDDSFVFEDNKRKKATRRKATKKKLFPFIQKKKYNNEVERSENNYLSMDSTSVNNGIRKATIEFLSGYVSSSGKTLNEKEPPIFEKAIYESSLVEGEFKKELYTENVRYFVGAFEGMKKQEIINEIRNKSTGWNSCLYSKAIEHEKTELNKLLNPLEASDNPDYPCPRCKSTKSYKSIKNVRSGDEGASALFLCGNRSCGFRWRING